MFRSQLSGRLYPPRVKSKRVAVEWRDRVYVDEETGKTSHGREIVKKLIIGPDEEITTNEKHTGSEVQVPQLSEHGPPQDVRKGTAPAARSAAEAERALDRMRGRVDRR